jgi:hypothetical protein
MTLIDAIINIVDWILQNAILPLLPDSNADFGLVALQQNIDSFRSLMIGGFSGFGSFFPMAFFLLVVSICLWSEFGLWVFHMSLKFLKWAHIIG